VDLASAVFSTTYSSLWLCAVGSVARLGHAPVPSSTPPPRPLPALADQPSSQNRKKARSGAPDGPRAADWGRDRRDERPQESAARNSAKGGLRLRALSTATQLSYEPPQVSPWVHLVHLVRFLHPGVPPWFGGEGAASLRTPNCRRVSLSGVALLGLELGVFNHSPGSIYMTVLSRPDGRPCLSRELLVLVRAGEEFLTCPRQVTSSG
jgi:hypothetical protein